MILKIDSCCTCCGLSCWKLLWTPVFDPDWTLQTHCWWLSGPSSWWCPSCRLFYGKTSLKVMSKTSSGSNWFTIQTWTLNTMHYQSASLSKQAALWPCPGCANNNISLVECFACCKYRWFIKLITQSCTAGASMFVSSAWNWPNTGTNGDTRLVSCHTHWWWFNVKVNSW